MHQPGALANASTMLASMPGSGSTDRPAPAALPAGGGAGGGKGGAKAKPAAKKAVQPMRRAANVKLTAVAGKFTELRVLEGEVQASEKLLLVGMPGTCTCLYARLPPVLELVNFQT